MNVTYQREVSHCSKSNYVKQYTVKEVSSAYNSDSLDIVTFIETDYQTIIKRGSTSIGEQLFFIPPESILPVELSEELGITKYLSKGKVQITKLRGNRSEGLVVDIGKATPYLDHILQWEDIPSVHMMGNIVPKIETPIGFEKFYKMPNIRNEPNTFDIGENIAYSEKIHGTNCRFGIFKNPKTQDEQLYVGSHNIVLERNSNNIYWKIVDSLKIEDRLEPNVMFYGEIYGPGIQDITYGMKEPSIKIFAISINGMYFSSRFTHNVCKNLGLDCVEFTQTQFKDVSSLKSLAEIPSEYYNGVREGIVVTSIEDPNKMAKVISESYLTRKNKLERH